MTNCKVISRKNCSGDLNKIFLIRAYDFYKKSFKDTIPYKNLRGELARRFSSPKKEMDLVLDSFVRKGYFSLIKFGKIKLNYCVK